MNTALPAPKLPVALVALDIVPDDPEANLDRIERITASLLSGIRLVVLPEMCLSGYTVDDTTVAGDLKKVCLNDSHMERLKTIAARYNVNLWGTVAAYDAASGKFRNRGFMIAPDGGCHTYDKRHIFTPGGEGRFYEGGREQAPTVEIDGWKVKMGICFDLRFPAWLRNNPDDPYDVLAVPANWPSSRAWPWHQLLIARAIENQCYCLGTDRSGHDMYGDYDASQTAAYDYWGKPIGERHIIDGTPVLVTVLNRERMMAARAKFPVLPNTDSFTFE